MHTLLSGSIAQNEKNDAVGLARVISMFMIIGCHLSGWFEINVLAMILNVGVYIFLIISGILYSTRRITQPYTFIKKRWYKLCMPMYHLVLFLLFYNAYISNYSAFRSIPTYLMNLQGTGFIIYGVDPPQMNGLGHLWFLTAIMICYLLLVIVKRIEDHFSSEVTSIITISLAIFGILDVVLAYTVKVQFQYFIAFLIGYALGKR